LPPYGATFPRARRTRPPALGPPRDSGPQGLAAGTPLIPKAASPAETPWTPAPTTPATAETVAEIAQAIANTFFTEMPSDCATCWLKAVARIARPYLETRKNQAMPIIIRTDTIRLMT